VNPFHSVGARLGLALAVVVAAALALVDLIVVPSLQHKLIHAKIAQLRDAAPAVAAQYEAATIDPAPVLQAASESAGNARISVFSALDPKTLIPVADTNLSSSNDLAHDPIAERANATGLEVSGTLERDDHRYAEVARPLPDGDVLLLSASLRDSLANVSLVRRRLLIAGLIALGGAVLVGYLAASVFARRVRRLERAADRIAGGDFSQAVTDSGSDELGQLAQAFERMRQRLAGLERARREFIANASHELRTPLFSLGGFLELLENEDLDPATQREFLETMREQIERLTKLATELLDLSRLDAGRMRVEIEPLDLASLAQTLASEFRAVAQGSGHVLEVADGSAPTAVGDEERTLQIGRILVENAIHHTPSGTSVRLSTARREGTALLVVEDDGAGIPPDDVPHVFERFYRVGGSAATGSGLGLAIARELAGLMGGSVELRSGAGLTMFMLVLPAASPHQDVDARSSADVPRENERAAAVRA
jgi:signal transduction histidine kinase